MNEVKYSGIWRDMFRNALSMSQSAQLLEAVQELQLIKGTRQRIMITVEPELNFIRRRNITSREKKCN
jgi:hypothetical protein